LFVQFFGLFLRPFSGRGHEYAGGPAEGKVTFKAVYMLEKTLEAPAIRTRRNVLMFLIPSLIGILLFMTPVIYDGNVTIPVAVLAKLVQTVFADHLVAMVSAIITTTMLMTLIAWLFKPAILVKRPFLNVTVHRPRLD
jgi:hypothetical protein